MCSTSRVVITRPQNQDAHGHCCMCLCFSQNSLEAGYGFQHLLSPAVPAFPCSILGQVCWLFLSLLFSHMLW